MLSIVALLILIMIVVVAAVIIYKIVYTYKINQKIQSGEAKGGKMMDMSKMVMVAIITGLTIFCLLLMYVVYDYSSQTYTIYSRNTYAVIDVSDEENYEYISYFGNNQLDDASFAKVYNWDTNEGYKKEVIVSGDYTFTVFTRISSADSFHPDFLCYVQYTGEKDLNLTSFNKTGFCSITEKGVGSFGEATGDIEDCVLYIGNLEDDCSFNIEINLLDSEAEMAYQEALRNTYDEDNGEFPEAAEFAISTAKVSIVVE